MKDILKFSINIDIIIIDIVICADSYAGSGESDNQIYSRPGMFGMSRRGLEGLRVAVDL